jgi:ankyrin repeat protein
MKYIKLFENFEEFDPYEFMMVPPQKKSEILMWEISHSKQLNTDLVNALIVMGADLSWEDDLTTRTLLLAAIGNGYIDVIQMLLSAGADPNQKSSHGEVPIIVACDKYNPSTEMIQLLIENGVNIDEQNDVGKTALHISAAEDKFEVVKLLLSHGANPNVQDENGNTPLVFSGFKMSNLLIEHGADESIKNNNGHTYGEVTDDELYGGFEYEDE